MGKIFIEEDSLGAIGNAIRNKTGQEGLLNIPTGMVNAINSIEVANGTFDFSVINISNSSTASILDYAFLNRTDMKVVYLPNVSFIGSNAFSGCNNLTDIYVPWSEGTVKNAPWGAISAFIHYNYNGGD